MNKISIVMSSVLVLLLSGCAPSVTKQDAPFVDALRSQGRVTIVSYEGNHAPRFGGGIIDVIAQEISDKATAASTYKDALNATCVAAMEESLAKGPALQYVPRLSLGLSDGGPGKEEYNSRAPELAKQHHINAFIRVGLFYRADSFITPYVKLSATWELVSPSNEVKMRARTEARAEVDKKFFSLALSTRDPKYESTFVELARKNAEQFLNHLKE